MTDLLRKWAKAEPERCDFKGSFVLVKLSGTKHSALSTDLLASERAVVLAAVIEAIEAREWAWSLHSYGGTVEAEVTVGSHDGEKFWIGGNGEHAYGLLLAYLAALEAEADQ